MFKGIIILIIYIFYAIILYNIFLKRGRDFIGYTRRILVEGKDPIEEFIEGLEKKDASKVLNHLEILDEMGMKLGPPYIKPMQNCDLWELRISYRGNQYRILFFKYEDLLILLHGFQYKDKVSQKEINIARARKQNLLNELE